MCKSEITVDRSIGSDSHLIFSNSRILISKNCFARNNTAGQQHFWLSVHHWSRLKRKRPFYTFLEYIYLYFLHHHQDEKHIHFSITEKIWSFSCTNYFDLMPSKHPPTNFHWHLQTTLILNVRRLQPQLSVSLCLGWTPESETRSNFKALFFLCFSVWCPLAALSGLSVIDRVCRSNRELMLTAGSWTWQRRNTDSWDRLRPVWWQGKLVPRLFTVIPDWQMTSIVTASSIACLVSQTEVPAVD